MTGTPNHPSTDADRAHAEAAEASAREVSFNIFQKLVRQWDDLHPYNGAQILLIQGAPDVQAIRHAWHEALDDLGLGCVRLNDRGYQHQCMNGEAATHTVRLLSPGQSLDAHISDELNRPFEPSDSVPFRPFLLPKDGGQFYLGVVYQHWVADSASIRQMLREWFVRVYDPPAATRRPVRLASGGYWKLFGPGKAKWQLTEGILSSLHWGMRFRRVRRIEGKRFSNFTTRFVLDQTPEGLIDRLRARARANHATVNDVFLAAIAETCNRHIPAQRTSKRQDLALGTIVDLRPHVRENLADVFGLFLGFTSVICRPRHFRDWKTLLDSISRQSALHKKSGVPQASIVRMIAGLAAGKVYSREKVISFYRKRVPLAGGISNVNLTRSWANEYHPAPLLDYIRVSPTGPMMPLVFTATSLRHRLNVGLSYRESIIPEPRATQIAREFADRLIEFGATCRD